MIKTSTFRYLILLVFLFPDFASAQTTIVLQPGPEKGKDAFLDSREYFRNFGDHQDFGAMAWTNMGRPVTVRSLIDFDLSMIPAGATILSARLSLYSYYSPRNRAHSTRDGSNRCFLRKVTEPWDESTVTWENQPATDSEDQIYLPASFHEIQDYPDIDVLQFIKEKIDQPNSNFGFMIMLEVEELYRSMIFGSSDNADPALRPRLEIIYLDSEDADCDLVFFPNPAGEQATVRYTGCNNITEYKIYDVIGRHLLTSQVDTAEDIPVYLNDLFSGTYFLTLYQGKERLHTIPFIIN